MKFRYVFVILGGIIITGLIMTATTIAGYKPNRYKFLGSNPPKKVALEPDPIGWVGREARYFVVHDNSAKVAEEAQRELNEIGWKRLSANPAVFGRGEHESIDVRSANQYNDKKLLAGIPRSELAGYTVIKIVDPRMAPALRRRIARWKNPLRRLTNRVAHATDTVG